MNSTQIKTLEKRSLQVREHIIKMATEGGCFLGASLSAVDILNYLYSEFLTIQKDNLSDPNRDYLLLSKGHDVPALYGLFVELGWLEKERLRNHLNTNDSIYWHPNRNIPGVEFHAGSLGQLPAVALGIAMDINIRKGTNKVICVLGDGELNEGSCWETFLVANAKKVNNLFFVIDRNHFQANMATEELIPLESLEAKFEAFGLTVQRINGHDFNELHSAFQIAKEHLGPQVIICDTVRGKGLPSIEARADRWFCNFSEKEIVELVGELHQEKLANITAETIVAR
jgi:transketolase